jgi:hypothetical protein
MQHAFILVTCKSKAFRTVISKYTTTVRPSASCGSRVLPPRALFVRGAAVVAIDQVEGSAQSRMMTSQRPDTKNFLVFSRLSPSCLKIIKMLNDAPSMMASFVRLDLDRTRVALPRCITHVPFVRTFREENLVGDQALKFVTFLYQMEVNKASGGGGGMDQRESGGGTMMDPRDLQDGHGGMMHMGPSSGRSSAFQGGGSDAYRMHPDQMLDGAGVSESFSRLDEDTTIDMLDDAPDEPPKQNRRSQGMMSKHEIEKMRDAELRGINPLSR